MFMFCLGEEKVREEKQQQRKIKKKVLPRPN
jgi:hypothetical protein